MTFIPKGWSARLPETTVAVAIPSVMSFSSLKLDDVSPKLEITHREYSRASSSSVLSSTLLYGGQGDMDPKLAARFVPARVIRRLRNGGGSYNSAGAGSDFDRVPSVDAIANTAMLLVDVSGLQEGGRSDGGELQDGDELSERLDDVLGGVERLAVELGGSVIHVAGTTVCCLFLLPVGTDAEVEMTSILAEECARRIFLKFLGLAPDQANVSVSPGNLRGMGSAVSASTEKDDVNRMGNHEGFSNLRLRGAVAHGELTVIRLQGRTTGRDRGRGGKAPASTLTPSSSRVASDERTKLAGGGGGAQCGRSCVRR